MKIDFVIYALRKITSQKIVEVEFSAQYVIKDIMTLFILLMKKETFLSKILEKLKKLKQ